MSEKAFRRSRSLPCAQSAERSSPVTAASGILEDAEAGASSEDDEADGNQQIMRSGSDATDIFSNSLAALSSPAYKAGSAEPDFARGRSNRLSSTALEALGEIDEIPDNGRRVFFLGVSPSLDLFPTCSTFTRVRSPGAAGGVV